MNNGAIMTTPRTSIIGLGNVLMGDDGLGPMAVEVFRSEYECSPEVEILDLGTPGWDLAVYLYGRDYVVIVDAVHADGPPGTVHTYCEADVVGRQVQLQLTAHDPGLQACLAQLRLEGRAPAEVTIVGVIPESCDFGKGISPKVVSAAFVAAGHIARSLLQRHVNCRRRHAQIEADLWWLSGLRLSAGQLEERAAGDREG